MKFKLILILLSLVQVICASSAHKNEFIDNIKIAVKTVPEAMKYSFPFTLLGFFNDPQYKELKCNKNYAHIVKGSLRIYGRYFFPLTAVSYFPLLIYNTVFEENTVKED